MPYIKKTTANNLHSNDPFTVGAIQTKGELNYCISQLMANFIQAKGIGYQNISEAISAAIDAAEECRNRLLNPYEFYKHTMEPGNADPYDKLRLELKLMQHDLTKDG